MPDFTGKLGSVVLRTSPRQLCRKACVPPRIHTMRPSRAGAQPWGGGGGGHLKAPGESHMQSGTMELLQIPYLQGQEPKVWRSYKYFPRRFRVGQINKQIQKATRRHHFTLTRMAIIRNMESKCWQRGRETGTLTHCWWECETGVNTVKNSSATPQKAQHRITTGPSNSMHRYSERN